MFFQDKSPALCKITGSSVRLSCNPDQFLDRPYRDFVGSLMQKFPFGSPVENADVLRAYEEHILFFTFDI